MKFSFVFLFVIILAIQEKSVGQNMLINRCLCEYFNQIDSLNTKYEKEIIQNEYGKRIIIDSLNFQILYVYNPKNQIDLY